MKAPAKLSKPGVDYYSLLGVSSTATPLEIKRAFREKILQVHLDKLGPDDSSDLCYLTIEAHRILSDKNLRQKYDVERSSGKDFAPEKFTPAGYICYDVGHHQMSRQLLDNISSWTKEFSGSTTKGLEDNYFLCFSEIMEKIGNGEGESSENGRRVSVDNLEKYYCAVCGKTWVTETHHWDSVINAYTQIFFSDHQGVPALLQYFETLIGSELFNWRIRYLPKSLLGIWASTDWSTFPKIQSCAQNVLDKCCIKEGLYSENPELTTKLESLLDSSSSSCNNNGSFTSAHSIFLQRSLLQNLLFVSETSCTQGTSLDPYSSRMGELLMSDDVQEILCLGVAMLLILKISSPEIDQLVQDALHEEQFELAMLWTMLGLKCGEKTEESWFELGLSIRSSNDPVLAHFCFLLAGMTTPDSWNTLADIFTKNGAHHAAIEYHLNQGHIFQLLHKGKALQSVDKEGSKMYTGVYYSLRVKEILDKLKDRTRDVSSSTQDSFSGEIEELIEIIQDYPGSNNPLEGFRIVSSTWPDVFEEPPGYWIHRATIQYLRRGRVNLKSQKLILAGIHFLPELERHEEIAEYSKDQNELTLQLLDKSMKENDFELMTDVCSQLTKRSLQTAESFLENCKISEETSPQGTNSSPGHKSALIHILSGTVAKTKEEFIPAMDHFQNALLSAPEVLHRVLPSVSRLVQDLSFHEAVVSQVHHEIVTLRSSLSKAEYPNLDTFSSDKRRSLIFTDTSPKMDYGYKDSVSKIQSGDPFEAPPPPPPEEEQPEVPPPPANTPNITLDKNSEAIQTGQMDDLSSALAYVDLLKALPLPMHPGPIVMAASHFLKAMEATVDIGTLYAYRNAIMAMAENLLQVDKKLQHTIHHGLTHKHMLSILLSAHEKLSKLLQESKKNNNNDSAVEAGETEYSPGKNFLIRSNEVRTISRLFQNVVNFPKVEPLASIPTLNCSDLLYVESLGNSFLSQFCSDKVRQKHHSPLIPKSLHAYTHFVEVWKGRSSLSDFPEARVKAMEELLALKGWTMGDVQRKMMWPISVLTEDGFSPSVCSLIQLRSPSQSWKSIEGFQIDYKAGTVELLMSRCHINPGQTVFDVDDIMDMAELNRVGLDKMVFSLETPDGGKLSSHPFKEVRIKVAGGQKSEKWQEMAWRSIPDFIQASLSRISMLLCYFASGLELCSEMPFWMRHTGEGLLSRMEEHLQHFCRPISWRKQERSKGELMGEAGTGKFWLNMVEVFEELEEDEEGALPMMSSSKLTYRVGEIRSEVRPNTFVMTFDPKTKKERLSAEAEFAKDLTRHLADISRHFPEFSRLQELVKIGVVCSKLRQVLKENKAILGEMKDSQDDLEGVAKVCSSIEQFLSCGSGGYKNSSGTCNWYPATFCNNMEPEVYDVTVGIELDPVVTYGPVPTKDELIRVPLEKVWRKARAGSCGIPQETVIEAETQSVSEQSEEDDVDEEEDDDEDCDEEDISSQEVGEEMVTNVPEIASDLKVNEVEEMESEDDEVESEDKEEDSRSDVEKSGYEEKSEDKEDESESDEEESEEEEFEESIEENVVQSATPIENNPTGVQEEEVLVDAVAVENEDVEIEEEDALTDLASSTSSNATTGISDGETEDDDDEYDDDQEDEKCEENGIVVQTENTEEIGKDDTAQVNEIVETRLEEDEDGVPTLSISLRRASVVSLPVPVE